MSEKSVVKWYYQPGVVVFLLFFVLGPIGLPLVYKSPKFNRTWKIIFTLLMILYTWYLIVVTIQVTRWTVAIVQAVIDQQANGRV